MKKVIKIDKIEIGLITINYEDKDNSNKNKFNYNSYENIIKISEIIKFNF